MARSCSSGAISLSLSHLQWPSCFGSLTDILPLIGFGFSSGSLAAPFLRSWHRVRAGPKPYFDKVSSGVWSIVGYSAIVITFVCLGLLLFGSYDCWGAMLFFAFGFVGFAEMVDGILLGVKPLIAGGAIGLFGGIGSRCCLAGGVVLSAWWAIPLFIVAFICMMIIPGHILKANAKEEL